VFDFEGLLVNLATLILQYSIEQLEYHGSSDAIRNSKNLI